MNASFCATASCLPIGLPHCTRSVDHSRAILVAHFDAPTAIAISASRPVFRVVSAILSPSPSRAIRFSSGTNTSLRIVTEFSIPRRPMNALRCRTVTPSLLYGSTNALIPPRWPSLLGTFAITTTMSATVPFVAHSLRPLIM